MNVDLNFLRHPKTIRLCGITRDPAAGIYLIRLWSHVGEFYPTTGLLPEHSGSEIEMLCDWRGDPGILIAALVDLGFMEKLEQGYQVHDWPDHSGHLGVFKVRAKKAATARWGPLVNTSEAIKHCLDDPSSNAKEADKQSLNSIKHDVKQCPILTSSTSSTKEDISSGRGPTIWQDAEAIVGFLNERTGKNFQARNPKGDPTSTLKLIHHLLKKQYTPVQIRQVIANRWLKWGNDPKMSEYLRPSTLFRPSKFENYLGELGGPKCRPAKSVASP